MVGFLRSKKFLSLVVLFVLLLIIIPISFILVTHSPIKQALETNSKLSTQKTQTSVFAPNTELATFNGIPIYVSDLNALAQEQYQTAEAKTLTAKDLNILLNVYVERKILDSQNLGDVSAQIAQITKTTGLTGNQAKYEALKEKFAATQTKSWSIYTVDFWLPPVFDLNTADAPRKQLNVDVNNALDYAKTQLQNGASVFNIATQITKNYPSIANILAINSLMFNNKNNSNANWNTPAVYSYDKNNTDVPFYKTIYATTKDSLITKVLNDGNMGGHVIKVVKVNNPNGILDTYENWLKNQESNLIITNNVLKNIK
jgi:hypothetical protein